jgi:hypothetical protein
VKTAGVHSPARLHAVYPYGVSMGVKMVGSAVGQGQSAIAQRIDQKEIWSKT